MKNGKYDGIGSLEFYNRDHVSSEYVGEFKDGEKSGRGDLLYCVNFLRKLKLRKIRSIK